MWKNRTLQGQFSSLACWWAILCLLSTYGGRDSMKRDAWVRGCVQILSLFLTRLSILTGAVRRIWSWKKCSSLSKQSGQRWGKTQEHCFVPCPHDNYRKLNLFMSYFSRRLEVVDLSTVAILWKIEIDVVGAVLYSKQRFRLPLSALYRKIEKFRLSSLIK